MIQFAMLYIMPVTVGLMFVGIIFALETLANDATTK